MFIAWQMCPNVCQRLSKHVKTNPVKQLVCTTCLHMFLVFFCQNTSPGNSMLLLYIIVLPSSRMAETPCCSCKNFRHLLLVSLQNLISCGRPSCLTGKNKKIIDILFEKSACRPKCSDIVMFLHVKNTVIYNYEHLQKNVNCFFYGTKLLDILGCHDQIDTQLLKRKVNAQKKSNIIKQSFQGFNLTANAKPSRPEQSEPIVTFCIWAILSNDGAILQYTLSLVDLTFTIVCYWVLLLSFDHLFVKLCQICNSKPASLEAQCS